MPVGEARGEDTEGGDVVGGINSEIARIMKISLRNMKLGQGKHTTQMMRVKYLCARKKDSWQILSPQKSTCVVD